MVSRTSFLFSRGLEYSWSYVQVLFSPVQVSSDPFFQYYPMCSTNGWYDFKALSYVYASETYLMLSCAQAIPRITSKGALCGAVYRVASERNLMGSGFGRSEDAQARFGF